MCVDVANRGLTATLFTHAETPAQLPPGVPVLVGDGVEVVAVGEAVEVVVVGEAVEVVVGEGEPETGHVLPRTVVIHEEPASGYCQTDMSVSVRSDPRHKCKRNYLPDHHTTICRNRAKSASCEFQGYKKPVQTDPKPGKPPGTHTKRASTDLCTHC